MQAILKNIYHNPAHPAGYGGLQKLQSVTGATKSEIETFATNENLYQKFKPARKRFPRSKFRYEEIDSVWALDTVHMRALAPYNNGINYWLMCVDSTSKYLWVRMMKTLQSDDVTKSFEDILVKSGRFPSRIFVDRGFEFRSGPFRKLLKWYKIKSYSTYSELKSFLIERCNRTVLQKL